MFKTTGKVNRTVFYEFRAHFLPPKRKLVHVLITILALFYSVLEFCINNYMYAMFFLILSVVLILEYFVLRNQSLKVNLKRMAETSGKEEYEYAVSFEEDGVVVENHTTGAKVKMPFDKFTKLVKRDNIYMMFTKTHQFIPIFVDCLSDEEKDNLLSFLKNRIPKLKV